MHVCGNYHLLGKNISVYVYHFFFPCYFLWSHSTTKKKFELAWYLNNFRWHLLCDTKAQFFHSEGSCGHRYYHARILSPFPTFHLIPSSNRPQASHIDRHAYEGRAPSYACIKSEFKKYFSCKHLDTIESGFSNKCHPCFARSEKTKNWDHGIPILLPTYSYTIPPPSSYKSPSLSPHLTTRIAG